MSYRVSKEVFGEIIAKTLAELPTQFAKAMETTRLEIRDRPTARMLREAEVPPGQTLLGLYHGRPETRRSVEESGTMPDVIYLFQRELEDVTDDPEQLQEQIRNTLLHELGHHFGLDEDDLDELGYS